MPCPRNVNVAVGGLDEVAMGSIFNRSREVEHTLSYADLSESWTSNGE